MTRLTAQNATALIVDLQEKIVPAMSDSEALLTRSKFFLGGLRAFDVPSVSTRQYPKGLGDTIIEIKSLFETHICVLQTALDLVELGKKVYLVRDCVSSRSPLDTETALLRLWNVGVVPTTSEAALFEIARVAGTPQFKILSKLATGR